MTSSKELVTTQTLSNAQSSQHIEQPAHFVLKYNKQQTLVTRPQDYAQLQCSIRDYFPDIPDDHRVSYFTDNLTICHGVPTKISPEVWASIIPQLDHLIVRSEAVSSSIKLASVEEPIREDNSHSDYEPPRKKPRCDSLSQPVPLQEAVKKTLAVRVIKVQDGVEERHLIKFSPSTTIETLLSCITSELGFAHAGEFRATWHGKQLENNSESIAALGLEDKAEIYVVARLNHIKSFIYLLLPEGNGDDISVSPSLAPEWHFSAIYPLVPIQSLPLGGQTLRWDVYAHYQGTYKQKQTGIEMSCLSWKAESSAPFNKAYPLRVSETPGGGTRDETSAPTSARLEPTNSVVVEVRNIVQYLENVLRSFYVPVEARTSFISYWLPSFLQYTHIALRLLPKSAHAHAPPFEVEPRPDVVLRVCMLFKGLKDADLAPSGQWYVNVNVAPSRDFDGNAEDRVEWGELTDKLGLIYLSDLDRFRVIELAGVEVLS